MIKIVLDTNCLLPSVFKNSEFYWLWDSFRKGKYTLCYSNEIMAEYEELLQRFYSKNIADAVLTELENSMNVEQVSIYYSWNFIESDADDNKFVDCAIASGAQFIVSNDNHFNVLKKIDFPKVQVINIEEFYKLLFS
jgi:putative PIN family toxin of toxin-antitoxin system